VERLHIVPNRRCGSSPLSSTDLIRERYSRTIRRSAAGQGTVVTDGLNVFPPTWDKGFTRPVPRVGWPRQAATHPGSPSPRDRAFRLVSADTSMYRWAMSSIGSDPALAAAADTLRRGP
jgi:hypothetical protein